MHVVVCVKQVPNTHLLASDLLSDCQQRTDTAGEVNPCDYLALECALKLKDNYEARVTLISMGPPAASLALQQCLAYGADDAVLLTDERLTGSDTFATSYALSAVIRRLSDDDPVTLVICGAQTSDGATGQVGAGIARHLGWQQITCTSEIVEVDMDNGSISAKRELECGTERLRTKLPAIITVDREAPRIRYASLPNLLSALRYTPEIWSVTDVALEQDYIGAHGSPTRITNIVTPLPREVGEIVQVEQLGVTAAVASAIRVMFNAATTH